MQVILRRGHRNRVIKQLNTSIPGRKSSGNAAYSTSCQKSFKYVNDTRLCMGNFSCMLSCKKKFRIFRYHAPNRLATDARDAKRKKRVPHLKLSALGLKP